MESARGHEITIEQSTTPAGWYNDPAGSSAKRWWDGVQWTAHLQAATPPAPPQPQVQPQPAPMVQQQPQFPAQPQLQPQQSAMVIHQPQQIDPQRVDPYAASNPYGLPPVQERPYVPMQSTTLPPVPMGQVHAASNKAAIGSVVVGAIAFCLSLVGFFPGSPVFYYSAGGVIAIIGGVRALRLHRGGYGSSPVAPIAAIILGSLAVLFMVIGIAVHTTANAALSSNGAQVQSGGDTGAGIQDDSGSETLHAPPVFAADTQLSSYENSASSIAMGVYGSYSSGQVVAADMNWPTSLQVDAQGKVMLPDGSTAAIIPAGQVANVVVSSDGKYFAVFVSGGPKTEAAIYDSESNSYKWVCDTGAPASCPAGGLDPKTLGSGSSGS